MDRDANKQQLFEVVRTSLGERTSAYSTDAQLAAVSIGDLDLDSLEKLQLILDLETHQSAMANETEVAACRTVGDLVALMARAPRAAARSDA
jgi:acyl carrier protein